MKKIACSILAVLCVLALLTGCAGGSRNAQTEKKILIAGKTYTESQLTAEIMAQLIEKKTDITVERKYDMASAICFESITSGDVDIYPEYTGGMIMAYLKQEVAPGTSPEETYNRAKEGFASEFDLIVLDSMGFNNTYANAVQTSFAEENNIKTNSDLIPFAPELSYGGEHSFFSDRLDGYENMCKIYGYNFGKTVKIDVGLKQLSMEQKQFDVTNVYTTDGWLDGAGLTVLEDDLNFFPAYYCCPVVRKDALEKYPEIREALAGIKDCCTEAEMIYYNNLVDVKGISIESAAGMFIEDKKL